MSDNYTITINVKIDKDDIPKLTHRDALNLILEKAEISNWSFKKKHIDKADTFLEVSKFDFDLHTANATDREEIRWSSPVRWNYYQDGKMIGYRYDSYGVENPPTYHIGVDK